MGYLDLYNELLRLGASHPTSISIASALALVTTIIILWQSFQARRPLQDRRIFLPDSKAKALPVLIVGAGPTGLTLASLLARYGVPFRIIEKKPALSKWTKATNLMQRNQEVMFALGLQRQLEAVSGHMSRLMVLAYGTCFGPRTMYLKETPFHKVLLCGQHNYERILAEDLESRGIEIEFTTKLSGLTQGSDSVVAKLMCGNEEEQGAFSYVVGCDGYAGVTKTWTKLDFQTTKTGVGIRQIDCHLKWKRLETAEQMWLLYFDRGFAAIIPLPEQTWRILFVQPKEDFPQRDPTLNEMQTELRQVSGDDSVQLSLPQWFSYTDLSMGIGPGMIDGRIILAGDVSNPILPNGGQGMNTGIGDAFNLGWKLAAVYKHSAPTALLATYDEERHALRKTLQVAQYNSLKYTTLYTPYLMQLAFRWFAEPLLNAGGEFAMAKAFSELTINVRSSSLSIEKQRSSGVRAGDRALDAAVVDGTATINIYDIIYRGGWTLLAFTGRASYNGNQQVLSALQMLPETPLAAFIISTQAATVSHFQVLYDLDEVAHRVYGVFRPTIYLVRPDGHVAVRIRPSQMNALLEFMRVWIPDASQAFVVPTAPAKKIPQKYREN
ncbi:hypothetical protein LTR78_000342 [Recurvomyces mirabilis]|uniref:FAD-binding domain-containing protein n=1 Tax=Recurvomyces mirabilis TaxID=574656 RepID=A0AAE0WX18_9PEZI|nr:hypothetical protein LTR78_000342 [Recurvomyces mirabilis]KAK5161997.1 hypothetical protein LTS14_000343 [Recurvomyces mirabilis]